MSSSSAALASAASATRLAASLLDSSSAAALAAHSSCIRIERCVGLRKDRQPSWLRENYLGKGKQSRHACLRALRVINGGSLLTCRTPLRAGAKVLLCDQRRPQLSVHVALES
jgi:hypothetical protein